MFERAANIESEGTALGGQFRRRNGVAIIDGGLSSWISTYHLQEKITGNEKRVDWRGLIPLDS